MLTENKNSNTVQCQEAPWQFFQSVSVPSPYGPFLYISIPIFDIKEPIYNPMKFYQIPICKQGHLDGNPLMVFKYKVTGSESN